MSEVRVHNLAISLDGFATGDGQSLESPFGHAGERLHEWMFGTRFWQQMGGNPGGTEGADHALALEETYDIESVSTPSGVTHLTFTAKSGKREGDRGGSR
jgi:hypothetical protein